MYVYVCMYVCVCMYVLCRYVYIYMCVCMYVYVFMYVCVYVCMHVRVYVCIDVRNVVAGRGLKARTVQDMCVGCWLLHVGCSVRPREFGSNRTEIRVILCCTFVLKSV